MPARFPSLPGPLGTLSRFAGAFRFVYMPLALTALVAVGIHAAADVLDDRVLALVDWCDARFDAFFGAWTLTEGLVELVGTAERTRVARGVTLVWELSADVVLALPMLGYDERDELPAGALRLVARPTWRDVARRVWERPTTFRITRPILTAAVALAGACTLAQLLQATVSLSFTTPLGGRVVAIAALVAVAAAFGTRAVLRSLEHAHEKSEALAPTRVARVRSGLAGTVVVLPLAFLALRDASPVASFFR